MVVRAGQIMQNQWILRILEGLFLLSMLVGVPAYFVWRVACR